MHYDRERVVQRMRKWESYLNEHALPKWEELPALDLYMDQVVALINSYLGFLPKEVGMDAVVTAAAINKVHSDSLGGIQMDQRNGSGQQEVGFTRGRSATNHGTTILSKAKLCFILVLSCRIICFPPKSQPPI